MKKNKDETTYIVCGFIEDLHTPESKEVKCCKCGARLWCSPWNLHLPPICAKCIVKLPGETKFGGVKRRDWKRAMEYIEQLRKNK